MIIVLPSDITHSISLVPRYTPLSTIVFELYNEVTSDKTIVSTSFSVINGILNIDFDFDFSENDKYQLKITDSNGVIYRGKIISTTQTPQDYKQTNEFYYYE